MKLSPRDQIIIAVVLIVLVAGAFFVFMILPRFGELTDVELQITDTQTEITTVETLMKSRQDAKATAAETQVRLLDIASRFPESPELPALIIELQDTANQVEIDFIQIVPSSPEAVEEVAQVSVIPVNLSIQGTWDQLIELLERLSGLRREVRIVNITVNGVPPEIEEETAADLSEGDEPTDGGSDTESDDDVEDAEYTVNAQVSLVTYMMQASVLGPITEGSSSPDAATSEESTP